MTWYLQKDEFNDHAFWDNYVHKDCVVISQKESHPFELPPFVNIVTIPSRQILISEQNDPTNWNPKKDNTD